MNKTEWIPLFLKDTKEKLFDRFELPLTNVQIESESNEYDACHFQVKNIKIRYRKAKITPKKTGLFVTLWKRNQLGITEPFDKKDNTDIYLISTNQKGKIGYFIFTKQVLNEKGILTGKYEGKRGFRIYPSWDKPNNKQAITTQNWQKLYFADLTEKDTDLDSIRKLFSLSK
ncbi:MepB family protein [Leptospira noumeaensis]|uniref:MepB family protein n=1 Tax=Leptospira noumeaensis TaxID=2484964 RepID=UPI001FCAD8C6|nr:MepB family protein [Leptospira noumeaensis]